MVVTSRPELGKGQWLLVSGVHELVSVMINKERWLSLSLSIYRRRIDLVVLLLLLDHLVGTQLKRMGVH